MRIEFSKGESYSKTIKPVFDVLIKLGYDFQISQTGNYTSGDCYVSLFATKVGVVK